MSGHYSNRRLLSPLTSRLQAMIGRCILAATYDSEGLQLVKVDGLNDEVMDKMEHPQPFGFTAHTPPGGQVIAAFIGGSRDQGVVLVSDHVQHRKKDLEEGETAHYSAFGTHVYLKSDGTVEIETAGTQISVNGKIVATDTIHSDADVEAAGDVKADGDVSDSKGTLDKVRQDLADHITAYKIHTHTAPGGATSPPV